VKILVKKDKSDNLLKQLYVLEAPLILGKFSFQTRKKKEVKNSKKGDKQKQKNFRRRLVLVFSRKMLPN